MNLEWIESFRLFAKHLNFTHAAAHLDISQPALHMQITKLSKDLGLTLYIKKGRSLVLTEEGEKVAAFAREISERVRVFSSALNAKTDNEPAKLAACPDAFHYLLGEGLRAFRTTATRPLQLITAHAEATLDAVQTSRAHMGVGVFDTVPDDLLAAPLAETCAVVAFPQDHRFSKQQRIMPQDLADEPLIAPSGLHPFRLRLDRALTDAAVRWEPAVEADSWELMLHFVSLGLGVAVVQDCCLLPPGVEARVFPVLPTVSYTLVRRNTPSLGAARNELETLLLVYANAWQSNPRSARASM